MQIESSTVDIIMKFAYLLVAHGSFELLKELVRALDAPGNDIFIHLDKKCVVSDLYSFFEGIKYSKVVFIKQRVRVEWGRVSLIKATMNLLQESVKGNYDYYHLLSGVDFPIKSNKHIADFFETNKGKEFVGFANIEKSQLEERLSYYHLISGNKIRCNRNMCEINDKLIRIQKRLNIRHIRDVSDYKKGSEWFSITHRLASELVDDSKKIIKHYKYTLCADEIFLQSYIYQHSLMERVYNIEDEFISSLRKIDWLRGEPYVWQREDFDELMNSPSYFLFARKFSETDMGLVKMIAEHIKKDKKSEV